MPWAHDGIAVWDAEDLYYVAGKYLFKHAPALGEALARACFGHGLDRELRPAAQLGAPAGAA